MVLAGRRPWESQRVSPKGGADITVRIRQHLLDDDVSVCLLEEAQLATTYQPSSWFSPSSCCSYVIDTYRGIVVHASGTAYNESLFSWIFAGKPADDSVYVRSVNDFLCDDEEKLKW